jgi:hypothetical protein
MGYMVTNNGRGGNKRCEFIAVDLVTSRLAGTSEVPCRSRYSFGMSGDGKKLYIYGAGLRSTCMTPRRSSTKPLGI